MFPPLGPQGLTRNASWTCKKLFKTIVFSLVTCVDIEDFEALYGILLTYLFVLAHCGPECIRGFVGCLF